MTFDFLPPQAYTKETLLKAYNWLQSQSDQIKELATTPDQLVSLFLKSTRLGQESLQRYTNSTVSTFTNTTAPVMATQQPSQPQQGDQHSLNQTSSSQTNANQNSANQTGDSPSLKSFKSELKNLAGMMGDLEKPQTTSQQSQSQANYQPGQQSQQAGSRNTQQPNYQSTPPTGYQAPIPPYQGPPVTQSTHQNQAPQPPPINAYVSPASNQVLNFDETTQILIREVKNELNLSSDSEALRMLVKIGYQKVRSLYK